jgi:endoglucanase
MKEGPTLTVLLACFIGACGGGASSATVLNDASMEDSSMETAYAEAGAGPDGVVGADVVSPLDAQADVPGEPEVGTDAGSVVDADGSADAGPGAPLPSGYFKVSGHQIVASTGANVRLACIGYDEPTGDYASDMAKIRLAGFNCVRQSWYDHKACPLGQCDFAAQDTVVRAAAEAGVKVVWSHHGNEGMSGTTGNADCASQQENGLWYDVNGTDVIAGVTWNALTGNFDGCGTPGTVTYATFKADSVAMATHYSGNSTVIAFDLWNEPVVGDAGHCGNGCQSTTLNWGGNNGADLRLMCTDTGTAVESADPGVLIVCEGAINFTGTFLDGTSFPSGANGIQDLSGAGANPVAVGAPEVVYSIHDYPGWLSGQMPSSGGGAIAFRNAAWGYLEIQRIAPVWVGEGGASLDGTDGQSAGDTAWATALTQYVNGQANGGPTFSGTEQPIGFDWWYFGDGAGQQIDGIYTNAALTQYNAGQKTFWETLLYTP